MGRRVFISHAVRDQKVVSALIDFLHSGLDVSIEDIFCTSELQSIPTGSDFIEEIRKSLIDAAVIVVIITPNYFDSPFCVCEMGAAWALKQHVYPILVPPIEYDDLDRTPLRSVNAIKMDNTRDLDKMRDEFLGRGIGKSLGTLHFNNRKSSFLETLNTILAQTFDSGTGMTICDKSTESFDINHYQSQVKNLQQIITSLQDSRPAPYLALSARKESDLLILTVRNTGSAITTIRLVSLRNDVKVESAFTPVRIISHASNHVTVENVVGFTIEQNGAYDLEFPIDSNFAFSDHQWVSSISLFHSDQNGRNYRAQVCYLWEQVGGIRTITKDVVKESCQIDHLPQFDPFATDIRRITELEMHRIIVYQSRYRLYHSARFLAALEDTIIPGIPFTNNKPLQLLGLLLEWNGFPVFSLKIDDLIPFQLRCSVPNEHELDFLISDCDAHLYDGVMRERKFLDYGLIPDGIADKNNLRTLYEHVDSYLRISCC